MKVTVTKITGFAEAFETMFISKRSWTPELGEEIRKVCKLIELYNHGINVMEYKEAKEKFDKWLGMLLRMGRKHITVLRFIDITIVTEGLHRAGQDDVDAHARRFDNRIIRNSTRLATFDEDEMSDYYKGKILTTGSMMRKLRRDIPEKVYKMSDGYFYDENDYNCLMTDEVACCNIHVVNVWVKATNGYILEEYKDNKDVKRGLYPLSIPSNFISKINLCEWGHVFSERNQDGGANPEVKDWAEMVTAAITAEVPQITREYVLSIEN